MLCPMKFNKLEAHRVNGIADCELSNCAWWTFSKEDQGYCAITRISESLDQLSIDVSQMRAY